jgi:hypothetical protein
VTGTPWVVTPALLEQLSSELLGLQFQPTARVDGRYERYSLDFEGDRQSRSVVIPLDPESVDFVELGLEAIAKASDVADSLGRSSNFLNALASTHQVDVVRFARDVPSRDGSIRWDEGERLFASARGSLTVAAKTAFERQAAFGRELKGVGQRFMESVRMGQTEVGSFVVTAFSPVDAIIIKTVSRKSSPQMPAVEESVTGRDVTSTLNEALGATLEIVSDKRLQATASAFESAVKFGVSRELLTSLADGVGKSGAVQVQLSGPKRGQAALVGVHVFEASQTESIRMGARRLAQAFPRQTVELVGRVEVLSRPKPGEFGIVRLEVVEGSAAKSVKIRLTEAQFEIAASSIAKERFVRVQGTQEREGDTFWMYNPRIVTTDDGRTRLI